MSENRGAEPFKASVIVWVVGAAILAVIAFLALETYAPEMRESNDGRAHVLSRSAIGFSGLFKLETELGHAPQIVSDEAELATDDLLIVTPEVGQASDVQKLLAARAGRPTLIILPKHIVAPDSLRRGWVRRVGDLPLDAVARTLAGSVPMGVDRVKVTASAQFNGGKSLLLFDGEDDVQTLIDPDLTPLFTDDLHGNDLRRNHVILARAPNNVFILAEPDLLNNVGISNPVRAYGAIQLLDQMIPPDRQHLAFDVTMNGFGHSRGFLDLIFRPPFLALTMCLIVAALMALMQALVRFGPPIPEARAIPRGKGALVTNTADLLRLARVEHQLGGRYVALIRDLAAARFALGAHSGVDEITARLDALDTSEQKFSHLAYAAEAARDRAALLDAARKLDTWRRRK